MTMMPSFVSSVMSFCLSITISTFYDIFFIWFFYVWDGITGFTPLSCIMIATLFFCFFLSLFKH